MGATPGVAAVSSFASHVDECAEEESDDRRTGGDQDGVVFDSVGS